MYSGEDSSGDPLGSRNQFTNWAVAQYGYQTNKDEVDWAALAQQWIQMKESCSSVPPAAQSSVPVSIEEQGEAPMEVVRDEEQLAAGQSTCITQAPPPFVNPQNWQAGWYPDQASLCTNWGNWQNPSVAPLPVPAVQPIHMYRDNTAPVPSVKNGESNSIGVPMDALKKKTLPAWIREGLEKMEREKQKQLEKLKKTDNDTVKADSEQKSLAKPGSLLQESEQSEVEDNSEDECGAANNDTQNQSEKTREETVEDLMLVVRKSLTELLLEVTNEEIHAIAQESLRKYRTKASSAQVFRKSAISSITGKLGLEAYADSASDSEDSESSPAENAVDSEEELKESIKNRQNAFKAIAQEIELMVSQSENKMQEKDGESTRDTCESPAKVYDKDSGETQPDKKTNSNGKRTKDRTSRFNAVKDTKQRSNTYIVQATAPPCSSYEYGKKKTNSSRRSSYSSDSSSDHYDSHKHSKRKSSRGKSYSKSSSSRRESSRTSSDSDDKYKRRKRYKSVSRDRSRSPRSRSRNRRSEKRY